MKVPLLFLLFLYKFEMIKKKNVDINIYVLKLI